MDDWGRALIDVPGNSSKRKALAEKQVSILSYNVLAQVYAKPDLYNYCRPVALKWRYRRESLLHEIAFRNADVLCLQEVDHYKDWWREQLSAAGYDSNLTPRPRGLADGIVIAWKRDKFQLVRSTNIDFNECKQNLLRHDMDNLASRCVQDNVGQIVALVPWERNPMPSGVLVANCQLASDPTLDDVRMVQTLLFMQRIEEFNSDFQLPVLLGGCFNCSPDSKVYYVLTTGRQPTPPKPPDRVERPVSTNPSRSSLQLTWVKPPSKDFPITSYKVLTRVGRNMKLGWCRELSITDPDCTSFTVTRLASGVTYEFKISAVNTVGESIWSLPSAPMRTAHSMLNAPMGRALANPVEQEEELEAPEVPPLHLVIEGPEKQTTGTTPRLEDGSDNLRAARLQTIETYQQRVPNPEVTGTWHPQQEHTLELSSAYRLYTTAARQAGVRAGVREDLDLSAAEAAEAALHKPTDIFPAAHQESYTFHSEERRVVADYIFFQHNRLQAEQVLSCPSDEACTHIDPREPTAVPDPGRPKPDHWDDRAEVLLPNYETGEMEMGDNPNYMGEYEAPRIPNPKLRHRYFPNDRFSSDHSAIMATFSFREAYLSSSCASDAHPPHNG